MMDTPCPLQRDLYKQKSPIHLIVTDKSGINTEKKTKKKTGYYYPIDYIDFFSGHGMSVFS